MSIVLEYFQLTKQYQEKYGKNTVLLYQVGSFFEIYSYIISQTNTISTISEIERVSEICNLNVAHKQSFIGENTKSNIDIEFPKESNKIEEWVKKMPKSEIVMSGFRDYSLEKFVSILTEAGYTTVVYVQEKDSQGKVSKRVLQSVYSPGTYISDNQQNTLSNNIVCIWFEQITQDKMVIGGSNVNIFTGISCLFEYECPFYMNPTTFDELEKFISEFNPNEIVLVNNFEKNSTLDIIINYIGINLKIPIHKVNYKTNIIATNCTKQSYIKQIISVFFGNTAYTACDFTTNCIATQSYCYLLNFLQEHNPDLVRKINLPYLSNKTKNVMMMNHTLKQLNIIDDMNGKSCGQLSSVLSFLNKCCTPMGKRQFRYQLLNPTFDEVWLNKEYSMIDHVLKKDPNQIPLIRNILQDVRDIDKINRQLITGKVSPSTLYQLYKSLGRIQDINETYIKTDLILNNSDIESQTMEILDYIKAKIDIDNCQGMNSIVDNNIIQPKVSLELDDLIEKQLNYHEDIQIYKAFFNNLLKNNEKKPTKECQYIKIHETEKSGLSFQITKKRGIVLKNILNKMIEDGNEYVKLETHDNTVITLKDIKINGTGTNDDISFFHLNELCRKLFGIQEEINTVIIRVYSTILVELESLFYGHIESIAKFIGNIDVIICKAFIAREYKYCRPELNFDQEKSFVQIEGLRHVLIEHIQENEIYVTNDIELGNQNQNQNGVVLFAVNSSGKTSLIRALGINIILAQSGLYVACSKFVYRPYKSIFCQIEKNDNLFRNMSTFQAEMSCLRVILKNADENSLILGDELANSTEIQSGISIMVATLIQLHEKQCSFIIASHYNQINNYSEITSLKGLNMKHMSVIFDHEKDVLLFNRKLQDGVGNTSYGLEVGKSLYMPQSFMDIAYELRTKYFPETQGQLSQVQSKYNSQKLRIMCEICNKNKGEEIHHLREQKEVDVNGFIEHFSKNHLANLTSVCKSCHDNIHNKSNKKTLIKKKTVTGGYELISSDEQVNKSSI
jgi:DNA mismatch repair protein MutS